MNLNVTIPVGQSRVIRDSVFDGPGGTGNDITNRCTVTVVSSDPTTVSITPQLGTGIPQANALKAGTVTITRTAVDNLIQSQTDVDQITVPQAPPLSQVALYQ